MFAKVELFGVSMRLLLQVFSLSDRYERKGRLLPCLLLAAVPALIAGSVQDEFAAWYVTAGSSLGVEFLVAVVLGHLPRARGCKIEDSFWKSWSGPPTTRWLRSWDTTCSDQLKSKWLGAIKRLTPLTLPASIPTGSDQSEVDRVNGDAIRQLRYVLRGKPDAVLLSTYNEEYGFAPNLCAVHWHCVLICLACIIATATTFPYGVRPYAGLAIAGVSSIAAFLFAKESPDYVRRCADQFSDSLFTTAMLVSPATNHGDKENVMTKES